MKPTLARGIGPRRVARAVARWIALLPIGLAVAAAAAEGDREEAPAPSSKSAETWYAQAMGRGDSGIVVSHFWSKDDRFRAEVVVGGHRIVTLVNGEYYYTLDELTGQGVGIRRAPAAVKEDATRRRPFGNELEDLLAAGGERIKTDDVAGRPCDLYRVTDQSGRRSVCADPGQGLPLQVERYDRTKGKTEIVNYLAWLSGIPIPDRFFEPDPRFAVERISLEDYVSRSRRELVGPAPPLYGTLLYGKRGRR